MVTGPGSHFCSLPETRAEAFDAAASFLKTGLDGGHRCVYIADANPIFEVRAELRARKLDLDRFEKNAQLVFADARDTPLKQDPLDPARLIDSWRKGVSAALADGFPAMRVVVEMTWALDKDLSALARYETDSAALFHELPLHALCLYDRTRFSETVLEEAALKPHPKRWLACEALGKLK